ncbi:hypothetical protein DLAC_02472 [Tieghemostelium lacteum]|uniref:Palmitoyltransferase n=1 Tax=Tieghemostelium lacteum TaxID=361077 RepID=A0A152A2N4_TIELA|nr:hypothetical protein DLAC_02472 [Tieghemostelium lacteum]|eukprot:KYR00469.1 hypothetical protein DLAC_02472 [Tieghemostelium lacteum]
MNNSNENLVLDDSDITVNGNGSVTSTSSNNTTFAAQREKKSKMSVQMEGRLAKAGWMGIHILIYSLLAFREYTTLNIAFRERDYFYLIWTHSIFVMTIIFYWLASIPPGYVSELSQFDLSTTYSSTKTEIQQQQENNSLKRSDDSIKYRAKTNGTHSESQPLIGDSDQDQNQSKEQEDKDLNYFCEVCKVYVPLRCKHCVKCQKCIIKYDHHCFFVGSCVGIRNHRYFVSFLVLQSALLILGFSIILTGFKWTQETWYDWFWENLIMLPPTGLIFGGFFMPFGLLLFHSYLIITNQTSWEFTKAHKITYLKSFYKRTSDIAASRDLPYPFNNGVWENIKEFLHIDNNNEEHTNNNSLPTSITQLEREYRMIKKWKLPTNDQIKYYAMKKKKNTIWNNEYYSCFG